MNNSTQDSLQKLHSMLNDLSAKSAFLRLPAVLELVPIGKSTWWAGVKDGKFPKPIKLSPRVAVWRKEDIQALIQKYSQQ